VHNVWFSVHLVHLVVRPSFALPPYGGTTYNKGVKLVHLIHLSTCCTPVGGKAWLGEVDQVERWRAVTHFPNPPMVLPALQLVHLRWRAGLAGIRWVKKVLLYVPASPPKVESCYSLSTYGGKRVQPKGGKACPAIHLRWTSFTPNPPTVERGKRAGKERWTRWTGVQQSASVYFH
jgi:hypothetical protein